MKVIWFLFCVNVGSSVSLFCSKSVMKGPFEFEESEVKFSAPPKTSIKLERIRIRENVELATMHRRRAIYKKL